jgi:hypothetical protein
MPVSPIPPARASGDILKKGTAVVTTFILSPLCAMVIAGRPMSKGVKLRIFLNIWFI